MQTGNGSALTFLAVIAILLTACSSKEEVIASCRLEALKLFGGLRKPHPLSGEPWPSKQEGDYVSDCMRSKGYKLICTPDPYAVDTADILQMGKDCWSGRFESLLPKGSEK